MLRCKITLKGTALLLFLLPLLGRTQVTEIPVELQVGTWSDPTTTTASTFTPRITADGVTGDLDVLGTATLALANVSTGSLHGVHTGDFPSTLTRDAELGALATLDEVGSGQITNGTIGPVDLDGFSASYSGRVPVMDDASNFNWQLKQDEDGDLTDIAALTPTDSNIIVGNGTDWVAESGATARTSLGLGTGDSPEFDALTLNDLLTLPASGRIATSGGSFTMDTGTATGDVTLRLTPFGGLVYAVDGVSVEETRLEIDTNGNATLQGGLVVNESGSIRTTRIEGFSDPNLFFVNSAIDRVGIGTSSPSRDLHVDGTLLATDYDVLSGEGNGLKFWNGSDWYSLTMGSSAEYNYGDVTGYSLKMAMNNDSTRGWTWGVDGQTPVASINTEGKMQVASTFTAGGQLRTNDSIRLNSLPMRWGSNTGDTDPMLDEYVVSQIYGASYGSMQVIDIATDNTGNSDAWIFLEIFAGWGGSSAGKWEAMAYYRDYGSGFSPLTYVSSVSNRLSIGSVSTPSLSWSTVSGDRRRLSVTYPVSYSRLTVKVVVTSRENRMTYYRP